MIDAQAVLAQLQMLGTSGLDDSDPGGVNAFAWLENQLQQTALEHHRSAAGDLWITLAGKSERAVVIGTDQEPAYGPFESRFQILVGLETLKAIARQGGSGPSCTLKLVVWAPSAEPSAPSRFTAELLEEHAAAYLELHVDSAAGAEREKSTLGMVTADEAGEPIAFNPRLMALCDEAILELTGSSASSLPCSVRIAAEVTKAGLAAAVMSVRAPQATGDLQSTSNKPLQLLQAAEAFGRWTEATMHLVVGESVDLWAQEHRTPHSS